MKSYREWWRDRDDDADPTPDEAWEAAMAEATAEIGRLKAVVGNLPLTADDVPVVPGMSVFIVQGKFVNQYEVIGPYGKLALLYYSPPGHGTGGGSCHVLTADCYSTRAASEAAAKAGDINP